GAAGCTGTVPPRFTGGQCGDVRRGGAFADGRAAGTERPRCAYFSADRPVLFHAGEYGLLIKPLHGRGPEEQRLNSIVWYDYQTFGAQPAWDRPAQFAAIRTDEQLNEIEEPVEIFCRQADDYLPHPQAVLITGIVPQDCQSKGVNEHEFMRRIN